MSPSSPCESRFGFERIIEPLSLDAFEQEYLERKPLLMRRENRAHFADLVSERDLETFVATARPDYSTTFAIDAGRTIATDAFADAKGCVDPVRLFRLLEGGATLVFRDIETRFARIGQICRSATSALNSTFQANVYWAPAGGQAFPVHYDARDVYALQVAGSKRWRIYGPYALLPDRDDHCRGALEVGEPEMDVTLRAGDALYLPRGFAHLVQATDEPSLHVSLATFPMTWADVLAYALATCRASDPILRTGLPPGFLRDDRGLNQRFADMMSRFAAEARLAPALAKARRALLADGFRTPRPRLHAALVERMSGDSEVMAAPDALYTLEEEPTAVVLCGSGAEIRFAPQAAEDLRLCLRTPSSRVRDIPGTLDLASRVELCRTLAAHGFLQPAHEE